MAFDIFDFLLKIKGFPLSKATAELKRIQGMGKAEFLDWQMAKAWEMVHYHYQRNEFYRKKVGKAIPKRWEDLPVITKKDLQQPLGSIISDGVQLKECYVGSTSGSSGTPFFFAKDKFAHAMTWAVIRDRYSWYGITPGDKQARFYGIPKEFVGYWKERAKDMVMSRVRFPVFDLSEETMARFFNTIKKNKFDYLYGYTNSLVLFSRYLIKNRIVLKEYCPTLKLCISTSEVCTPEDHELLVRGFGVKHIREYGASETCLMGFDAPDGNWRMTEETLYTEVAAEDGKTLPFGTQGNVLCTSLFNQALPMIRYQIGDMAIINDRQENNKYRSIGKLMGRTNDTAILPSGRVAAGLTFYYISRSILESSGVLREFIIRQIAADHFVFDVVSDRELTPGEEQQIKSKMDQYLEPGLKLTINRVQKINRPASGKLKHFYSELPKP